MTAEPDDILDGLFHGCALAAWLDQAAAQRGWPDREATKLRAYRYYEEALAGKNAAKGQGMPPGEGEGAASFSARARTAPVIRPAPAPWPG